MNLKMCALRTRLQDFRYISTRVSKPLLNSYVLATSPKKSLLMSSLSILNVDKKCSHNCSVDMRVIVEPPGGGGFGGSDSSQLRGGTGSGSGSSDKTSAGGGNSSGGGKDGQLCCPKCGNPCTHVETFVCMNESKMKFSSNLIIRLCELQ